MSQKLPPHARRFPLEAESAAKIFKRLEVFHGISPEVASERLHDVKRKSGLAAGDNVIFDFTGNVYDPVHEEWLGSMTEGGAKA